MLDKNKVFISYSHKDTKIIDKYVEKLQAAGFGINIDKNEFRAGEKLGDAIFSKIRESFCTVFFLSEHSIQSSWCLQEMQYLHEKFETNTYEKNRQRPLRGCIVVRIGDNAVGNYNAERDFYSDEAQECIGGFYNIFKDENLDILDSDKDKYDNLCSALKKIKQLFLDKDKHKSTQKNENGYGTGIDCNDSDGKSAYDTQSGNRHDKNDENITYQSIRLDNGMQFYNLGLLFYYGEGVEEDDGEALRLFTYAAKLNYGPAYTKLGNIYEYGFGVDVDKEKAFDFYQKAAELDDEDGYYYLGRWYEDELKQNELAFENYQKAAEKGHARGQHALGLLYKYGNGVEENPQLAFEWINKAAEQQYNRAVYALGLLYRDGIGVEADEEKGYQFIENGAELGYVPAMDNIADYYRNKEDYEKAVFWYQKAIDEDYTESCLALGWMYEEGTGVKQNISLAKQYYQKAIELSDIVGYAYLGRLLLHHHKTKKELKKAIGYFEKAVSLGFGQCALDLADAFFYGQYSVEKDYVKAFKYYSIYIDKVEDPWEMAVNNVAFLYETGLCNEINKEKAIGLYESTENYICAARLTMEGIDEHDWFAKLFQYCQNTRGRYNIAWLFWGNGCKKECAWAFDHCNENSPQIIKFYYYGQGVEKDHQKVLELCQQMNDHVTAQYFMGKLYEDGLVVERDYEKALEYYENVKEDEILAAVELAKIYYEGRFCIKDDKKAFDSLEQYSSRIFWDRNDFGEADYWLGFFLENGIGCDKNIKMAIIHYTFAHCKWYGMASVRLGRILFGRGYKKDAVKILAEAANRGEQEAEQLLDELMS